MTIEELPKHLQNALHNREVKLIGKTDRTQDREVYITLAIVFLWLSLFLGVFAMHFAVKPLLSEGDFGMPAFVLISVCLLFIRAFIYFLKESFFSSNVYFVLTSKELIRYINKKMEIIDWQIFTDKISVKTNKEYSDIKLTLKTGLYRSFSSSNRKRYTSDTVRFYHVKNAYELVDTFKILIPQNKETKK